MAELIAAYPPVVWTVLLLSGAVIGLLAGLLGVGGGVIAVPVLLEIFQFIGVDQGTAMSLAVGTAQANILIASLTAASTHWRTGTIDLPLVRAWLPALLIGTVFGLWLGAAAPANVLIGIFATATLALALKLGTGDRLVIARSLPRGPMGQVAPALVGALASAVGVGGGTLSTPVLSLFSFPIKRAIGAAALFNLVIAAPATAFFLATDVGRPGRTIDAIGDVAFSCLAALSLPALFVAPLAARWSARAPVVLLRRLLALCLAAVAVRLLFHG